MTPAPTPMRSDDIGPTNPDAGVMATNPATAPLAAPRTVGFPRYIHSITIHDRAAAAVALFVTTNALVANPPAATALPALNPNHPNHSRLAPKTVIGRLCGAMFSFPWPKRRPRTRAHARPETPELICTTVPPAKSSAPIPPLVPIQPPLPHTQWASGS